MRSPEIDTGKLFLVEFAPYASILSEVGRHLATKPGKSLKFSKSRKQPDLQPGLELVLGDEWPDASRNPSMAAPRYGASPEADAQKK
jgi:hypothetical protein